MEGETRGSTVDLASDNNTTSMGMLRHGGDHLSLPARKDISLPLP